MMSHNQRTAQHQHWNIHRYTAVASTQELALTEARRIIDTASTSNVRTAYVANEQSNGYGQHGRKWLSPAGGLYLSMIFPDMPSTVQPRLPLVMGIAVATCIERLGIPRTMIRWPNDVLIAGKKVAGVLSQAVYAGSRNAAVVGIGLNLNTDLAVLGSQVSRSSTSVAAFTNSTLDPETTLTMLLEQVDMVADHLLAGRWETLYGELKSRDALQGCLVSLRAADQVMTGRADGFADDGSLRLHTADGVKLVSSGTIQTVNGDPIRYDEK